MPKLKVNRRLIVVGANSFLASSICKKLETHFQLVEFTKNEVNLMKLKDLKKLDQKIKTGDLLLFAAGIVPVKNISMYEKNIKMMINFLNLKHIKKLNHIFYLSSDAVYSDVNTIVETSDTNPNSLHGSMRIVREKMLLRLNIPTTFFRPTLVYGIGDPHNGYGPNKFIKDIKKNKNIVLFGKGEEKRDHIYINNFSDIVSNLIINRKKGVFNIATGNVISFKNIAKKLLKITNSKKTIIYKKRKGPMPHGGYRAFNIDKIKRESKFRNRNLNINLQDFNEKYDINKFNN